MFSKKINIKSLTFGACLFFYAKSLFASGASSFTGPTDEMMRIAGAGEPDKKPEVVSEPIAKPVTSVKPTLKLTTKKSSYSIGEYLTLTAVSSVDCYLTIVDIGSSGKGYILFPNAYQTDNFIKAGQEVKVPNKYFDMQIGGPVGKERLIGICRKDDTPVIEQGYVFRDNVFISLGKMKEIFDIKGLQESMYLEYEIIVESFVRIKN